MRHAIVILAAGFALAACNTVEGFGKDIALTGNALAKASHDTAHPPKTAKTSTKATKAAAKKPAQAKQTATATCSGPPSKATPGRC